MAGIKLGRYVVEVVHGVGLLGGVSWGRSKLDTCDVHSLASARKSAAWLKGFLERTGNPRRVRVRNVWNNNTWEVK